MGAARQMGPLGLVRGRCRQFADTRQPISIASGPQVSTSWLAFGIMNALQSHCVALGRARRVDLAGAGYGESRPQIEALDRSAGWRTLASEDSQSVPAV